MSEFQYVGSELEIFEHAVRWKAYFRSVVAPYFRGDVLEVGAGLGANTPAFADLPFDSWTCLEPDGGLATKIPLRLPASRNYKIVEGTLASLPEKQKFDVILYIDVLEHIEHDAEEMTRAAARLNPGGSLIVLSPAHQWLFAPFDTALGHYRRYSKRSLAAVAPRGLKQAKLVYLDSIGMLASLANRLILRSAMPTLRQILTWDRLLVPLSRYVDPMFFFTVGKSVVGVWKA